jgi:hypothetical protein
MKRNVEVALIAIAACSFAWAQTTDRNVRSAGSAEDEAAIRGDRASPPGRQQPPRRIQKRQNVAPDLDWKNAFGVHQSDLAETNKFMAERARPTFADANQTTLQTQRSFLRAPMSPWPTFIGR